MAILKMIRPYFRSTIDYKMYLILVIVSVLGNACGDETQDVRDSSLTPPVLAEPPVDSDFYKICINVKNQPSDVSSSAQELLLSFPNKTCKEIYWHLKKSKSLTINSPAFTALPIISEFNHLDWLDISSTSITSLNALNNFSRLTILRIRNCPQLIDLDAINNLTSLQVLNLYGTQVANLDFIKRSLTSLHFLNLARTSINDLSGIIKFPNLKTLIATNNTTDFTAIRNLSELTYLDISYTNFDSTEIINSLPKLKHLIATQSKLDTSFKKVGLYVRF